MQHNSNFFMTLTISQLYTLLFQLGDLKADLIQRYRLPSQFHDPPYANLPIPVLPRCPTRRPQPPITNQSVFFPNPRALPFDTQLSSQLSTIHLATTLCESNQAPIDMLDVLWQVIFTLFYYITVLRKYRSVKVHVKRIAPKPCLC